MRAIGKLGEIVWVQWDELRHAAAVIGTVLSLCVQPRYWARPVRNLFAQQLLAVGVEKTLLVKANRSMDELQVTLKNLQQASGNLQLASTNLPPISDAIGQEAKDLPGLVLQTQTSMRELERLIEAMQRHWLLRKYVNETNPPPIRPLPASEDPQKKPVKAFRSPRDSTR